MSDNNGDIQFLIDLQREMNAQDNDCQASPRFWTVGDYTWVGCPEDNAERFSVYLPSAGESYEVNEFLKEHVDQEELSDEAKEEFSEITCEESALEWIQKHEDEDARLCPERKEHIIRQNTMFLTKSEAKRHIELNHYHYSPEAHTYAMTAWRAPKVERLLKILHEFDFNPLVQLNAKDTEIAEIKSERDEYRDVADKFAADVREAHEQWINLQTQLADKDALLETAKEAMTAVIEDDRKTIGKLESDLAAVTAEAKRYMSQIAERDATIATMAETLEWYSDDQHWGTIEEYGAWVSDGGERARQCLQSLKEPNT